MSDDPKICATCNWWRPESDELDESAADKGECMYAPPTPIGARPATKSDDYCSVWEVCR